MLVGGDSGGPLFDMQGRVIGIHSRIGNSVRANLHVPSATFRQTWDRLARGEAWGARPVGPRRGGPYVGVVADPESDRARILAVQPGSPAEAAGVRPGDVITKLGGKPVKDFPALAAAVRAKKPGDKVAVEIERAGETLTLELTIGRFGGPGR
jgi:serine protease Do